VGSGCCCCSLLGFYFNAKRVIHDKRWLLLALPVSIPVPWMAAETGWFVAEFGRQPWAIGEVLPTGGRLQPVPGPDDSAWAVHRGLLHPAVRHRDVPDVQVCGMGPELACTPAATTTSAD
jgi:hypothetical protein